MVCDPPLKSMQPYASVGTATVCREGFQCSPGSPTSMLLMLTAEPRREEDPGGGGSGGAEDEPAPAADGISSGGTGMKSGVVCADTERPQQHLEKDVYF